MPTVVEAPPAVSQAPPSDVGRRYVRAAFHTGIGGVASRVLTGLAPVILARYLGPQEYEFEEAAPFEDLEAGGAGGEIEDVPGALIPVYAASAGVPTGWSRAVSAWPSILVRRRRTRCRGPRACDDR